MRETNLNRIPVSTYRLQLNRSFPFAEAQRLAPYLTSLGITEYYCSSFLAARSGSTHGYDLCDHSRINPELGGREAFQRFSDTLRENGFGLILDFVPNHMSTDPAENLWWRNVLENGPSSPYATSFDIDWAPVKTELRNKVLLPVLGEQYGVALESGELQIVFENGQFHLRYFDLNLPLNPRRLHALLSHNLESFVASVGGENQQLNEFQSILFHLKHLPAYTETGVEMMESRQREKEVAIQRITRLAQESTVIRQHIEANVHRFNGSAGDRQSFDLLHELLELQPYRLSYWRTAMHEINYRRFFDINELAGIRMEDTETFRRAHELVFELIRQGEVTGLRFDHIDGLYDPAGYLDAVDSASETNHLIYRVVEKILSAGEQLPVHWKTHGSSGYDFLNDVNGLFVDSRYSHHFRELHQRFTGEEQEFREVVYTSKKLIIGTSMASELNVLAHELNRISERHRRFRDFTLDSLQEALREIVACFPVYRSYVVPGGWHELDQRNIDLAVSSALLRNPALEPSIFHFIRQMLLPERTPDLTEEEFQRRLRFSMKFQQYTGPVQAKGVEDTAFYRYGPLLSLNEVGGDPSRFGRNPEDFHNANGQRQKFWPLTMLTTSTHDTKRGEDARARINVLSEIPAKWSSAISRWARANASARTLVRGKYAPDRSDEYLYYQALLGAWPPEATGPPERAFIDRMSDYMQKAVKEKKTHSSWMHPSADYDNAVSKFVERSLTGRNACVFLPLFLPFQERVASIGMINSLSQLILKIGSPGVPDFYQGSELWDLNLVDPDNRRAVDFGLREQWLESMRPLLEPQYAADVQIHAVQDMLQHWQDGRIKLFAMAAALGARRRYPEVFVGGEYIPLAPNGPAAQNVVAFARAAGNQRAVILAPRLVAGLSGVNASFPIGAAIWQDVHVPLPENWGKECYRNIFTGEAVLPTATTEPQALPLADIFKVMPIAVLVNEREGAL
ncbi:MAG: malto-oligosyltrehalose synthase [Acidobacteriota bacterium]